MPASLAPLPTRPSVTPDVVDDVRRREFLGILVTAGLLAGCASDDEAADDAAPTRTITDRLGRTVEVPAEPRRVVVLDPNRAIADVVALGVTPVGATTNSSNPGGGFSPYLGEAEEGMVSVGVTGQADVEQVAALDPDLILFATIYQEGLQIETLAAIAPVVAYEAASFGLLEPVRWLGDVLGRQDEADRLEREFGAVIDARGDALGLEGLRVASVNLGNYEAGASLYVLGREQGISQVLGRLGAVFAPEIAGDEGADVSLELIGTELADTDLVVALRYGGGAAEEENFATVTGSPVWQGVPAVAAGRVVYLDIQEANGNYGLAGIEAALDQFASQLA